MSNLERRTLTMTLELEVEVEYFHERGRPEVAASLAGPGLPADLETYEIERVWVLRAAGGRIFSIPMILLEASDAIKQVNDAIVGELEKGE